LIVLDTNVLSELMRPAPDPRVVAWLSSQQSGDLATTAITVAEIRYGLERLPAGRRKRELVTAAGEIFSTFADTVLPFDTSAAQQYAGVVSRRDRSGRPISVLAAQIAAICLARKATLATRNHSDFSGLRLAVTDPWKVTR
jgi:toxin FitB